MAKKKPTYKTELLTACREFLKKHEPGYGKKKNTRHLFLNNKYNKDEKN